MESEKTKEKASVGSTPGLFRQLACVLVISGTYLAGGTMIGWPAVLPLLYNDTSTEIEFTSYDTQWLVSIIQLPGLVTPLVAGFLMEKLGPCRLQSLCLLPTIGLWLLMAFLPTRTMLYIGRLGLGIANVMFTTVTVPLLAEISSPQIRGMLTSFSQTQFSTGLLVVYVMAKFLSWQLTTALCSAPLVFTFLFIFLVPESPYWLAKKNKDTEALQALSRLRGPDQDIKQELLRIKTGFLEQETSSLKDQFKKLKYSNNYKPIILILFVWCMSITGGQPVVFQYTVFLFKFAKVEVDPFTCTILVGLLRLLFSTISSLTVEFLGRRILYVGSGLVCGISLVLTACCLLFEVQPSWLIIVFVLVFVAGSGAGVCGMPYVLTGEVVPTAVRSLGSSLGSACYFLTSFGVLLTFPILSESIGMANCFFMFAFSNFSLAFLVWRWVPETQGRSLVELQDSFKESYEVGDTYRSLLEKQTVAIVVEGKGKTKCGVEEQNEKSRLSEQV
ncbi:facilitated trehalose transporter Tret1-like [Oratosquilla oratoria]|uniref:facilitated trehalose transporter Tret1-like n=1 Tax=Oratosquilla oratoria TaxID=337810 RepID=UPI003F7624BF